jgi:hypothetical protein
MEEQAAAVQIAAADTEISTPKSVSSRAYIEELKAVSAAVVKERKKKKGRSTKAMIQAMNAHLMVPNSVNCHITKGLAGQSPKKRCRHRILPDDAVLRIIDFAKICATDLEPLAVNELTETTQTLIEGTELQASFKNGIVSRGHTQAFLNRASGHLQREYPQAMTHDRAEWCTWANIEDYFGIIRRCLLEFNISAVNPGWEPASEEERTMMVPIIHEKPGNICGCDEMPYGLDMNTGQKSKKDKKITCVVEEASFGGRRSKCRGRQRTSKFNKMGTIVAGSKGNDEPLIPMLIVKAMTMHPEYTYSDALDKDNNLVRETLSPVFSGGKWHDPVIAASASGGMTPSLFHQYIEQCVLPCYPLISPTNKVLALWDGDQSHLLKADKLAEYKALGLEILPPKPNTSSDCQREDLSNFPVMQPEIRLQVAKRQRMLRKLHASANRPLRVKNDTTFKRKLGARDMVSIAKSALDKGTTKMVNANGWRLGGIVPFTRAPLMQPHILQTKGKTVLKKLLNWEAIDYSIPVTAQIREQLGKGRRMTTGVICDRPMTSPEVIRLFARLEQEKLEKVAAKVAAAQRVKKAAAQRVKKEEAAAQRVKKAAEKEELKGQKKAAKEAKAAEKKKDKDKKKKKKKKRKAEDDDSDDEEGGTGYVELGENESIMNVQGESLRFPGGGRLGRCHS